MAKTRKPTARTRRLIANLDKLCGPYSVDDRMSTFECRIAAKALRWARALLTHAPYSDDVPEDSILDAIRALEAPRG
jgi:hypothetical protein